MDHENDRQLEIYSAAFEYYLEKEALPEELADDLLGNYMKTVLDDPGNRHLCLTDPIWKELILNSLLDFFRFLLPQMEQKEQEKIKELEYIENFYDSDITVKRILWQDVMEHVTDNYSPSELNMDGYIYLMKKSEYSKNEIFASMVNDWKKACEERIEREKQMLLENNRQHFEEWAKQAGQGDYERINSIASIFVKYPKLKEIIQIMGREKKQISDEVDSTVTRYIPILLSHNTSHEEVDGIKTDDDLNMLLPTEIALLNNPETESVFYHKYSTKQLQSFSSKPPVVKKEKTEKQTIKNPRLQEGPIIVSVDTSGSMEGKPEQIAKSLLMQILQEAKRKKRKCYLITFSVHTKVLEISNPMHWRKVKEFMGKTFIGGTDGEQMLSDIINVLKKNDYSMADALIISDFDFPYHLRHTRDAMLNEQAKGTRFYGLQIGKEYNEYIPLLDKVWTI